MPSPPSGAGWRNYIFWVVRPSFRISTSVCLSVHALRKFMNMISSKALEEFHQIHNWKSTYKNKLTSAKVGVEAGVDERVEGAVGKRRVVGKPEEAVIPVRKLHSPGKTQPHRQNNTSNSNNKSAQSNLARGPRRGAVAHVRPLGPCGPRRAPNWPPKVLFIVDRSPNPTISLIPGPVQPTMPNGIRIRSAVFSTMHWTDGQTDRQTDSSTDRSSTGKFDDYSPLRL